MKKIFFSLLAIAAIASCAKTEPTFTEVDSEIKIAPVTAVSTKAVTGAIDGTKYPAKEAFKVYAYWNTNGAGSDFNSGTTYLNNVKFVNKGAYWGGETTYYWPKNGSLRFAAYSPADLNMTHDLSNDTYTLGAIEYPTVPKNAYDILVATTSESYTAETAAEKVSVVFEHALSWISFNIQSTVVANDVFDVKEVIVNDVAYKGGLNANMTTGTKTWTLGNDVNPVTVFTGNVLAKSTAARVDSYDNLVLPQTPTTVTVKYTQNEMSHFDATTGKKIIDSPKLENQKITVSLVLDNEKDTWEPGKHYTYTILFDLDEILINPSVEDWEETTEVIVNSDPVKVQNSEQLIAAVAEGKDVILDQNITLDHPVVVEPIVTTKSETAFEVSIDLNGKDIIAPSSDAIVVDGGASLTINGNGKVWAATNNASSGSAVWLKHGNVTINGGNYFVGKDNLRRNDCIYVGAGAYKDVAAQKVSHLVINGGTFAAEKSPEDGKCWVLNLKDEFYREGSTIQVKGGTYNNFDPAAGGTENPAANFVAEGYASYELASGVWTVVSKVNPVEIATVAALEDAAAQGGNVVLGADITVTESIMIAEGKELTLNLNGHNIKNTTTQTGEFGVAETLISYGTLTINGEGTVESSSMAVWARGNANATIVINGGTYEGCADAFATGGRSVAYASGNATININGGTFKALAADNTSFANKTEGIFAALNVSDNNGNINVYGGTFVKFNPAVPGTEPAAWNTNHPNGFVATGYKSVKDGDNYVVIAE